MSDSKKFSSTVLPVLLFQQTLGAICFPIAKYGLETIDPFVFAFYRFVISAVVLLLVVRLQKHARPIDRADYWRIIGLGVIIIPFNQVMYLFGQSLTGAGHGSVLFATTPIWIFLAALVHLKEKVIARRVVGIVVALVGVIITVTGGAIQISTEYLWGDLIILIAVFAWAYYTVLGKPLARKYGAIRITAYALASGSALYFPFGLYAACRVDYSATTVGAWASVVYMALGVSVGAYVLWYWVLKYMDASRIAVFHNLQPIIATVVAYFWLGEQLGLSFFVGGVIVLAGVMIAEVQKRPGRRPADEGFLGTG